MNSTATRLLRIALLGALQVERSDAVLSRAHFDRRQVPMLLAYLLSAPGRAFSQSDLVAALWPELDPDAAEKSLRAAVSKLRKALEPDLASGRASRFIVKDALGYAFVTDGLVLDSHEVEAARRRGMEANARGQSVDAVTHFSAALALFRGDYCAEDRESEWVRAPREHWRRVRAELALECSRAHTTLGHYPAAIEQCRTILAQDAAHEAATRQWMLCAYLSGHQQEALAAFEQCRRALAALDVAPEEETLRLAEQIRARRVAGVDKTIRVPVQVKKTQHIPHSLGRLQLVGRDAEIAQSLAALDIAAQGQGATVAIVGEPGIGKTRLAEEILFHARDRGGLSASGVCHPEAAPYEPFAQIFRQLLKGPARAVLESAPPVWRATLARLLPELRRPADAVSGSVEEQHSLRETLALLLIHVSLQYPLTLLIDDAQWADDETLDALSALRRHAARERIMILLTCRADEVRDHQRLAPLLAALHRHPSRVVTLSQLTCDAIAALLQGMAPQAALSAPLHALVQQIHARTQGNPLFVVEVLQALFEKGVLAVNRHGKWTATGSADADWGLPQGVRQVIAARLARLTPELRAVLDLLAPLTHGFRAELLTVLRPDLNAAATVEELLTLRFLVEDAQHAGTFRFAHENIRETLYDALGLTRRQQSHRALAQALEADPAGAATAQEIAQHWLAAAGWAQAIPHLVRAVDAARSAFSYAHAATLARSALELLDQHGALLSPGRAVSERLQVLRLLDGVLHQQGQYKQREPVVAERIRIACETNNHSEQADATLALADLRATQQEWHAAIELIERAFVLYHGLNDVEGMARAQRDLGYIHWRCMRLDDALAAARAALKLHETVNNLRGIAGDLHNLAQLHAARGDFDEGYAYCERARMLWNQIGDRNSGARVLAVVSRLNRTRGDLDAALVAVQEGLDVHHEMGDRYGEIHFLIDAASLKQLQGASAAAIDDYMRALTLARHMGGSHYEGNALGGLGLMYEQMGRRADAVAHLREAAARFHDAGDLVAWAEVCEQLGELLVLTPGEYDKALPYYQSALNFYRAQNRRDAARGLLIRIGYAHWRGGRLTEAIENYSEALIEARAANHLVGEGAALAALGVACRDAGRLEEARQHGEAALAVARRLEDEPAQGHVLASLSQVFVALGDLPQAATAARAALAIRERHAETDPVSLAWAHCRLGEILEKYGDAPQAQEYYRQARHMAQNSGEQELIEHLKQHGETQHAQVHH